MIPTDLKPGAIVRCTRPSSSMPTGEYVLKGYVANPHWISRATGPAALIEGKPNNMNGGDQGWMLYRFVLIRDGDGSDYQADDDVDLVAEPTGELYGRQYRLEPRLSQGGPIPAVDSPHYPRHDLTATEQREQERETARLYANMTVRIERI